MKEALRAVPLFADLTDEDFDALAEGSTEVHLSAGELLFAEGDKGDHAYVVTGGEVEIFKTSNRKEVLLAVRGSGNVIGEMALLDAAPRTASVRAKTDVTMITIGKDQLDHLLDTSTTASRSMFELFLSRWRQNEALLRQSERMAQLGTLTAGLAHELNNPAAAVRRGAGQLRDALGSLMDKLAALPAVGIDASSDDRVQELLAGDLGGEEPMDALARSDLEEELEDRLDDLGVPEAWKVVPDLVEVGITVEEVDRIFDDFGEAATGPVLAAAASAAQAFGLLHEVEEGASRLSDIVAALKSYSYLDQAPVQDVDVTKGIDDTLLILKSKLKGIEIRKDYAEDLPRIEAYGSELNQVWTNLIDNAADALNSSETPHPRITVRASRADDSIVIEVEDNGPGIPEEIQHRVFDTFFTTKPPGKGTGLGLDISYSIVVDKHAGDLELESEPGKTIFRARLPVRQPS